MQIVHDHNCVRQKATLSRFDEHADQASDSLAKTFRRRPPGSFMLCARPPVGCPS